jgi:hypothetical protein
MSFELEEVSAGQALVPPFRLKLHTASQAIQAGPTLR